RDLAPVWRGWRPIPCNVPLTTTTPQVRSRHGPAKRSNAPDCIHDLWGRTACARRGTAATHRGAGGGPARLATPPVISHLVSSSSHDSLRRRSPAGSTLIT